MYNLLNKNYDWINWVELIDSWKKWPNLWISVCTHWWEVVWLDILEYLKENWFRKSEKINKFIIKIYYGCT